MKLSNWDYWTHKLFAVLVCLLITGHGDGAAARVITIEQANIVAETSSKIVKLDAQSLPFRWDLHFPSESGRVRYTIYLPPRPSGSSTEPYALYIPKIGNQVQVFLNGVMLDGSGVIGNPRKDTTKAPYWRTFPVALLSTDQPSILVFETSVQALRWGGLSEIFYGPESELHDRYKWAMWWQNDSYLMIISAFSVMGVIAWVLWLRQGDGIYGLFALSAGWGAVSTLCQLLEMPWLIWPMQGIAWSVALAWHVVFMARFTLEVIGRREHWVKLTLLALTLSIGIAYILAEPVYWTIVFGFLCLPIVVVLICTGLVVDQHRSRGARLLFVVSLIVAIVALRDFFVLQLTDSGMSEFSFLPHALLLYVLVMGWIVVTRYMRQHRQYHELNLTLEKRITAREDAVISSFEIISRQEAEKAKLLERQRIMSDIHDGVGGQLVGLVNMIKRGGSDPSLFDQKQIAEHAQMAIDELRVAIDSMQSVDGDLATVLATLRYRLAPRLEASDIDLIWRVEALPVLQDLTPQKVLQIQRILLEAFANILKHSKAHNATLSARYYPDGRFIRITLVDDGIGFEPEELETQGHGLRNMRFRANAIEAEIAFERESPRGCKLTLTLPVTA
ncbi:MAG: hypothetical protein QM533_04125 [Cytophagales bacterium]|nr:hypothetical protein [Cytophagales bacterium]